MRRVVGETIDEMKSLARRYPDETTINWPPRGPDCHKSKSIPMLWLEADRADILEAIDSSEVSDEHILVLTWMIRREWYETRSGVGLPEDIAKFFELEIRGNLIRLLRAGAWIDEPVNLSLKNLNSRLEKIDLGRRSDLNFSSHQSEERYDPERASYSPVKRQFEEEHKEEETLPDWEAAYRDGDAETRADILSSRPWMKTMLTEKYG